MSNFTCAKPKFDSDSEADFNQSNLILQSSGKQSSVVLHQVSKSTEKQLMGKDSLVSSCSLLRAEEN